MFDPRQYDIPHLKVRQAEVMRHFLPEIRRISPVATSGHVVMKKRLEGSVSGCTGTDPPVSE